MSKKISSKHSSWNFEIDNVNLYSFWNNVFSKEECQKIINIGKNKGLIKGVTSSKSDVRKSKVSWLYPDDIAWVYERLTNVILELNQNFFKFDIFGLSEGLQFTSYKAPSDKYGKHVDRGLGIQVRKLSVSIQLTDPNEYNGGDLKLYDGDYKEGFVMDKTQGTLVMFPSYVLHEVTPVTKGERNSLVTWVTGKQFK
jgi:PKHD-type hydroxylase